MTASGWKLSLVLKRFFSQPSFSFLRQTSNQTTHVGSQIRRYSRNEDTSKKDTILPKNVLHLHERGVFEDIYPPASVNLPNTLKKKQCFYCGFDPTADSLHVGNLLSIMALLHCQRAGHEAIAVIGTATARAGDPSGHKKDRQILEEERLFKNAQLIADCIERIVENHAVHLYDNRLTRSLPSFKIMFNHEWYEKTKAIDFIVKTCKNFRIGPMMEKRYIRDRIDSAEGLSLAEFMYQVLQANDWMYLWKKFNCCFQIGGIDQLGNISAGHDLIRKNKNDEVYGMFTPLVTTSKGEKLGKSAGNSIWLDPAKTSPFEFYQYFFRQPDAAVERFLRYFTFIDLKQIEGIMNEHMRQPHKRNAQAVLARNVCKIVHGESGLKSAELCTRALYEGKLEDIEKLSEEEIQATFSATNIVHGTLEPDTTIYDLAVNIVKAIPPGSKGEHVINGGGVRINGQVADSPHEILISDVHVLKNDLTLLTVGKVNHYIVRWKLPRIQHDEIEADEPPPNSEIPGVDVAELTNMGKKS